MIAECTNSLSSQQALQFRINKLGTAQESTPSQVSTEAHNKLKDTTPRKAGSSVPTFFHNLAPRFGPNVTAHLEESATLAMWKTGGFEKVISSADAAASKHPSQICTFNIFHQPCAYLRKPSHLAQIFHNVPKSSQPIPNQGDSSGIYPYLFGHSILDMLDTDPEYAEERLFYVSNLISAERLSRATPKLHEAIQKHFVKYPPQNITNLQELRTFVNRIVLTMIAETQLGLMDLSEEEKDYLSSIVTKTLPEISTLKLVTYLKIEEFIKCRPPVPLDKVFAEGRVFLQKLLDRNKEHILKERADPEDQILLQKFILKTAKEKSISIEEAFKACHLFAALVLFSGYESTATHIFFTLLLLADPKHSYFQKQLQKEIDSCWDNTRPLTKSELDKMEFMTNVNNESLRVCPPFSTYKNKLHRDVELDGVLLKKGTPIFMSPLRMHKIESDSNVQDPKTFIPREGLDERDPSYKFYPFGESHTRICPGRKLAGLENKALSANLFSGFDVHLEKSLYPIPTKEEYSLQLANTVDQVATKINIERRKITSKL